MHAEVTAHNGFLILNLLATASIEGEVATSIDHPHNLGQVIMDSAKHLGISKEALELVKSIKRGSDSIGDVDWWKTDDGKTAFAWFGGPKAIKKPEQCETSRQFAVGEYVEIPNNPPEDAVAYINSLS